VPIVKSIVSEEHIASIVRMTRIGELRTTLAVSNNWIALLLRCVLRLLLTANFVRFPMKSLNVSSSPNPVNGIMFPVTRPLTEMGTMNLPGGQSAAGAYD
jgi:hypothetical protein